MKICMIGTGYVGLVTSVGLASIGHNVLSQDLNLTRINLLKSAKSELYVNLEENCFAVLNGDDVIYGGLGWDTVAFDGNMDDFTFAVDPNGTLTVTDVGTGNNLGVDTISGVERLSFDDGDLTVTTTSGGDVTLKGSYLDDVITLTGSGGATLDGEDGADTLTGGAGADTLYGGHGNDDLSGSDGADALYGGYNTDTLHGDGGADMLSGGFGTDTLSGGDGADTLYGDSGADKLFGDDGNDVFDFDFAPIGHPAGHGQGLLREIMVELVQGERLCSIGGRRYQDVQVAIIHRQNDRREISKGKEDDADDHQSGNCAGSNPQVVEFRLRPGNIQQKPGVL